MNRDRAYLLGMLVLLIQQFTRGIERSEFEQNIEKRCALERCIINIGEAANRSLKRSHHNTQRYPGKL